MAGEGPTAAMATRAEPMRYTGKGRSEPSSVCSLRSLSERIHGGSSSSFFWTQKRASACMLWGWAVHLMKAGGGSYC